MLQSKQGKFNNYTIKVLSRPSVVKASDLMLLSRGSLRMVVRLDTGGCIYTKTGVYNDASSCSKCGLSDESAKHILFDWNSLMKKSGFPW